MSDKHQHADLWAKFRALFPDIASGASELKSARPHPEAARSLIRICKEHGVGLRLEPDGTLVVASNGRAWRSLVDAIEENVDAVAELVSVGWDGSDG
jgi:hypothetical protein